MKHRYLVSAAVLCCVPQLAFAQETPPADGSEGGAIVVTGQRAQQERSIQAKRDAIGVIDVAAADEIGQLPDRNVAEVIEHLPGVGVAYDQGEGRYVSVRGVPSALNGYTLDGLEIGNPDGTTRALPLDVVSGQLLNRVEVAKVKTADQDGQGIGGTINLVTQTAFDYKKTFNVSINAQAGYQELNQKVPVRGDASVAARFGADEQFGLTLGVSYSDRDFVSEGFYPDDWRAVAGFARGGTPTNIKYTEYSLDRKRTGATGSFDWHPNDHQTFYVRGLYSKFIENEIRARYRLDFATQALVGDTPENPAIAPNGPFHLNPDGETGYVDGKATSADGKVAGSGPERREDLRLDYKVKTVMTGLVGGSTELDRLKLEYIGAYSHNEVLDRFPTWQFRCNPGTVDFDFSQKIYSATPRTECTPDQLQFRSYLFHHEAGTEDIWQGKFDATYDLGGDNFLKVGAKYRASDRDFDSSEDTWGRGGSNARFTMGQFGLGGPAVIVHPDDGDPGRSFVNSPTFNIPALKDFTAKNINGAYFVLDGPTSLANATLNDFVLSEDVSALYAMANFEFGALTVTPGLRWEHTKLHITGNELLGTTVTPTTRDNDYDDFLPTLVVRIRPSSKTVFRLAYSRSIGRPEYANLSPGAEIEVDDGTQPGLKTVSVSFGNPDLKPFRSDNLDATAEWYFARGGLLSVGVFAKFITNPIFTQSYVLFNTTFNGQQYETAAFSQPLNADKADIIGLEAQYQQQFDFLPGLLSGFGVSLNATVTGSQLRLPSGATGTFPGQSDYLYGAKLFYQKGIVQASIAYHNTGKQLISAGLLDSGVQDQFNDDLRRLDAKASFKILPYASVFFEAQNLTDEPTRQYQSNNTDWLIQNERYGRTFYAGVSAKF